jgi:hypothetical protein
MTQARLGYFINRIFDILEWWLQFLFDTCKNCNHPIAQHRGSMGPISTGQHFHGMCVNGFRHYGYEIYRHCGCWDNVPNWKFWIRRK